MTYARPTEPLHVIDILVEGFRLFRAGIGSSYVPALLLVLIVESINHEPFARVAREIWPRRESV